MSMNKNQAMYDRLAQISPKYMAMAATTPNANKLSKDDIIQLAVDYCNYAFTRKVP